MRVFRVNALPAVREPIAMYLVRVPGSPETFQIFVTGRDGVARGQGVAQGAQGLSAYQAAVAAGFVGTEDAWLASLRGPAGQNGTNGTDGVDGVDGIDGADGLDGAPGQSAYQIAVAAGFQGSEAAWIASLQGPQGPPGLVLSGTATLNVQNGGFGASVTVAAGVTAASRIVVSLGSMGASDENEADMLGPVTLGAIPGDGQIEITATFLYPQSGPVPVTWGVF